MGSLYSWLTFLGALTVFGLPLTIALAAFAGVLWAWFDHLPGWFFVLAFGLCLAIGVRTVLWGESFRFDGTNFDAVIPQMILPLNLVFALPVLLAAFAAWRRRRQVRQSRLRVGTSAVPFS